MEKAVIEKYNGRSFSRLNWNEIWIQVWSAPNLLSISRVLVLPVVVFFIVKKWDVLSVISLALLWLSDYVDGFIARRFKLKTDLGLLLDPMADKITGAGVLLALYFSRGFPLWVVLMVIGRDALILSAGYYLFKRGIIISSNEIGRKSTVLFSVILILYLLHPIDGFSSLRLDRLAIILSYLLIAMVLTTLITYSIRFLRIVRENNVEGSS